MWTALIYIERACLHEQPHLPYLPLSQRLRLQKSEAQTAQGCQLFRLTVAFQLTGDPIILSHSAFFILPLSFEHI